MVSGDAAFLALRTLPNAYDCPREVMKMGRKLTGCRSGPMCACGAVASEVAGVCEKCRFRVRWLRRKTRRSFSAG
jgi:hypothetical protein